MPGMGWRWMRGRGAAPLSFFVCAILSVAIALLGKTQASLVDGARAKLSDFASPALSETRAPLAAFERWTAGLSSLFGVYRENIQLRQENAELRKWQNVALALEDRVKRYELLLNAAPNREGKQVTARVIGESNRPFVSTMILNAGADEGVKKGQAVVDNRGLVGRIYLTGERTSWVILLTDLNSRVPVVIEPSRRRAILVGDNTASPKLELDVGDGRINPGDRVLTTGDGGLLPPDLPVGVVMEGTDTPSVAMYAAADATDYVQVLDYGPAARLPATSSADVVASSAPTRAAPAPLPVKSVKPVKTVPLAEQTVARAVTGASDDEDR
jgi:rod shape-determining protein MreC